MQKPKFISSINHVDVKEFKKTFKLSINNKDYNDNTALMLIIQKIEQPECTKQNKKKYYSMIDTILESDEFNVNAQNKKGNTALHLAVLSQDEMVVRKLCKDINIDPDILNNRNQTPLELAENNDNQHIVKIIKKLNSQYKNLEKASTSVTCKLSDNVASLHCSNSDLDKVQTVIPKTKNINEQNNLGQTKLLQAVLKNDLKSTQQLLKQGANPNIPDNKGDVALLIVTRNGNNIKLLKLFLKDKRTDFNIINKQEKCFVDLILDNIKKIGIKESELYFNI